MSYLTILLLICLGLLIIISGFLSGSETALTATSKPRIFLKFKKGNKRAKYLLKILDNLENVISALLLSNNLVNILASSLATAVLYDLFGVSGIFYATMIMTIVIVIFAEILPKTYSLGKPNRTALQIAPIIFYLSKLLYPIIFLINLIVKKIFLKKKKEDDKFTDEQSEEELQGVIDMYKTSSPDSEHEKDMLQSILTLNDTTVEEVFTHRKNIYSIDSSLEINEIIKKMNAFFGYEVVQTIKLNTFDGFLEKKLKKSPDYATKNKHIKDITNIKNEKIRNSLLELSNLYKKK